MTHQEKERYLSGESGSVTVEFTTIFLPVMLFVMTVLEIGIAFQLSSSAQKAAVLASRLAASQEPVHEQVWDLNEVDPDNGQAGDSCFQPDAPDACVAPTEAWVCDGAALGAECSADRFNRLLTELRRTYPTVDASDITVRYDYRRLGVAGGPFVPQISVSIDARESPVQFLSLVGLLQLRPVTASILGEDME